MIKNLITNLIPTIMELIAIVIGGVIVAFIYEWRTAAVALGLLPLIIISGMLQIVVSKGIGNKKSSQDSYHHASSLITESIKYIRTVVAFGAERTIQLKHR